MRASEGVTYRRVAILKPGRFQDAAGMRVDFSPADLAAIAESYDPQFHAATLNIDHQDRGPALGVVSRLYFADGYLWADLASVSEEFAEALDAGRYPFRSAEVYPDLGGRGLYLRALALLGARPPAVKGLPPLPPREPEAKGEKMQEQRTTGLGQASWVRSTIRQPLIYTIMTEASMSENSNEKLPGEGRQTEDQPAEVTDPVQLAEENHRLIEENRRLRQAELERQVASFLGELREAGKLTPALEQAGIEEALVAAEELPTVIRLADGSHAPLSQVLKEILKALPAAVSFGITAQSETDKQPALSPDELAVASSLGLSEAEYLASQPAG